MTSRFGVDISNLDRAFGNLIQSEQLKAERIQMQREREAQGMQALLMLALTAGGAGLGAAGMLPAGAGALAGAQGGAAIASLVGPRPNIGNAVNLGLGAAGTVKSDMALAEKKAAMDQFASAVNPAPQAYPEGVSVPGTFTPPPDRQAAAAAAMKLGDVGTAAHLAFPAGQKSGEDLFDVRVPDKEDPSRFRTISAVTMPVMQTLLQQNPGARAAKLPTGLPETEKGQAAAAKQGPLYDVVAKGGQHLVANAVPLEEAKAASGTFPGSRIRKFDAALETDKGAGKEGAGGGGLKAFEIFDPGVLRRDAEMSVARTTGRSDIFDLLKANAGAINAETLAAVGELPKREIQKAYLQQLEDFAKSNRPAESVALAKEEVKTVKAEMAQFERLVGQAKAELKKAKTEQERKAIFAQAGQLGITRGELE